MSGAGTERSGSRAPAAPGTHHPLLGARLEVLVRMLVSEGGVTPRHAPLVAMMLLSAALRLPFRALDELTLRLAERRSDPGGAPLFILGHWRSGTTHLHNLLGTSPAFGIITPLAAGIPDEMLTLARWFRPLLERALPDDRVVDAVRVLPRSPQEDEIPLANMGAPSIYHGLYFPRRFHHHLDRGVFPDGADDAGIRRWASLHRKLLRKVAIHQGTPRVVIKNVVYTARLAMLREIWPEARFVFIRRSPYEVFASTMNYYRRLLPMLALQDHRGIDLESIVLGTYSRLMDRYLDDRRDVPGSVLTEVSFEELTADPLTTIERIHRRLDLPGWEEARPLTRAYLDSVRRYKRNSFTMTVEEAELVERAWGRYLALWGYARPPARRDAPVCLVTPREGAPA